MFDELSRHFSGELYYNDSPAHNAIRLSYATDASVYQERPLAVAIPKTIDDLKALVHLAAKQGLTLIPRAAGTSLAGQVVGSGLVVDISKFFTAILGLNETEQWVRVQPGVIRDDLNAWLKPFGFMFGPETSTANRAMIGGMIGNNSCGLHSIVWGDTRTNLLEVKVLLADGSEAVFGEIDADRLEQKCGMASLEGTIYRELRSLLSDEENKKAIQQGFPKPAISRRNTGYALDALLATFEKIGELPFNLCQLVAGSEGTLCLVTEAKLRLRKLPPPERCIVAVHTASINEALLANLEALRRHCSASELVDDVILQYTKTNIDQRKNRFFVEGDPKAILMVEFFEEDRQVLDQKAADLVAALRDQNLGYAYPILYGADTNAAWDLRKSGLGLLRNEPGDTQPVNLIEDCAVAAEDLPAYIAEVETLLQKFSVKYSMYAHAGAGELHVEPMINLKTAAGRHLFRTILSETARIVKRYGGSLSGEHGDGRLRGEFIPFMMGEKNYRLFQTVKAIFDPSSVFNRGKIVDTPPMNEFLRYAQAVEKKPVETVFDFTAQEGILHLAEKCSGSGDCRKTHISGGTMCPSFMATRSEKDTTRARANLLRHYFTGQTYGESVPVTEEEVKEVLELCLSCKACKSECPSSVDVAKMKAEFTQRYHDKHGVPLRSRLVGRFSTQMKWAALFPAAYNLLVQTTFLRRAMNNTVGFHPDRSMPTLHSTTFRRWMERRQKGTLPRKEAGSQTTTKAEAPEKRVNLFCDEFTNYNDVEVGQKMVRLLEALGYTVVVPPHVESGRTFLSKGMVREAKALAIRNVGLLKDAVESGTPLIGVEPSAILTLRDEYPELVPAELRAAAKELAKRSFLFEEWFAGEVAKGSIHSGQFTPTAARVFVHGHCYQKALSSTRLIRQSLSVVPGFEVNEIPSGCCGMAGSFGYEKEHYEVSMKIGNLVLFPAIRETTANDIIAASGTSCRHQIKDGTGRKAKHTAEILYEALAKNGES